MNRRSMLKAVAGLPLLGFLGASKLKTEPKKELQKEEWRIVSHNHGPLVFVYRGVVVHPSRWSISTEKPSGNITVRLEGVLR